MSQINFYELSKQRILSNFSERYPIFSENVWSDGINTTKQLPNGVLALYMVSIVAVPYNGNGQ